MSESEAKTNDTKKEVDSEQSETVNGVDTKTQDGSAEKAVEQYRKLRENIDRDLTEKEIAEIDKECEIIRNRETITQDTKHDPVEITTKDLSLIHI